MKYEYWQTQMGQWYWHLRAANGEIIAYGEGYYNEAGCKRAIDLVRSSGNAPVTMKYEYWKAPNRQRYWHLRAANNEIIAQGEGYHNEDDCERAIQLVKSSGNAPVIRIYK